MRMYIPKKQAGQGRKPSDNANFDKGRPSEFSLCIIRQFAQCLRAEEEFPLPDNVFVVN